MKNSEHAFFCWIGTLLVLGFDLIVHNITGALAVGFLSTIILLITIIFYIKEKKDNKNVTKN